jgi:tetratricopeptide (TPR) repeat protein
LLGLGYPITALKKCSDLLNTARRNAQPFIHTNALVVYLTINRLLGDTNAVAELVEELAAITAEHEMVFFRPVVTFYRAWLAANAGHINENLSEMRRIITQLRPYPPAQQLVVALAEVCCRNGQPDDGLDIIEEALIEGERVPYLQAEFYRLKGEFLLMRDRFATAEAEKCFREALEVARGQEAKWWELRASVSLARLLRDTGRRNEACTLLTEIYNWFTEGFDTADLKDAKALLSELNA